MKYNNVLSDPLPVTSGLQQGSILGTLFVILLMNEGIIGIYVKRIGTHMRMIQQSMRPGDILLI